jgi:hypothetical protein
MVDHFEPQQILFRVYQGILFIILRGLRYPRIYNELI